MRISGLNLIDISYVAISFPENTNTHVTHNIYIDMHIYTHRYTYTSIYIHKYAYVYIDR